MIKDISGTFGYGNYYNRQAIVTEVGTVITRYGNMNLTVDNITFLGKWNIFSVFGKRRAKIPNLQQADTFTRTIPKFPVDFRTIQKEQFLNGGREASVYRTNYDDYVLRITKKHTYNPDEMIPVTDGNGLILATNKKNTVQILKYHKGEPLYGKHWDIIYSNLSKDEYLEHFNKIKELPDESFAEFIRSLANIRKSGYEIDSLNPNNVLLDGTHLNIVDIEKSEISRNEIHITDFYSLVDFFHIREIISQMNEEEFNKFNHDIKMLFNRIIEVAKKEGYNLDKKSIEYPKELADIP